MQDIHSIGGGGRFFTGGGAGAGSSSGGGGGGGGDRRLRPNHHHLHNHHHQQQAAQAQALKCPRCDSANTKFCYYNNYNLSQPRHFCKSCRRYWTKGGVLRNVPVGGGCRKTKRSKQKASSAVSTAAAAAPAVTPDRKSPNSHSSSESSSLTAGTNTVSAAATTTTTPVLEGGSSSDCGGLFTEIGTFANMMAVPPPSTTAMPYEFGPIADVSVGPFVGMSWNQQSQKEVSSNQEIKVEEIAGGGGLMIDDQTAQGNLSVLQQDRSNGGGFGSLGDWQQCGDQVLFDLPNTVDQTYWSQSQWNDQDHPSLYLP